MTMAYTGQIPKGYKDGAITTSDDFESGKVYIMGGCSKYDAGNQRWTPSTAISDIQLGFNIDGTHNGDGTVMSGSDVAAAGKLPVLIKNALVASSLFAVNATGVAVVPTVADIGKYVQCNTHANATGKWQIVAAPGAGEVYVGTIRSIQTYNDIVMAVFDYEPRLYH